jgi:hypothetical protein
MLPGARIADKPMEFGVKINDKTPKSQADAQGLILSKHSDHKERREKV